MRTQFDDAVCDQVRGKQCGHCWACAMRHGLVAHLTDEDSCLSEDLVGDLFDAIEALREVHKSASRGESQQHAIAQAARTITNMVVDIHEVVSTQ